jgi:hypothetical protein
VHLVHGREVRARRPHHFFRENGVMPAEAKLSFVIPAELGDADEVIAELRDRVSEVERSAREERARSGRAVVGRRRILEQSWRNCPSSVEPRRNLRPRFAGRTGVRVAALRAFREFLAVYRDARRAWLAGTPAKFPPGTYWLARFAPITVAPLPPLPAR